MAVVIKIKYHSDQIEKLRYIDGKSDWIDLRSAEDVVLKKGDFHLVDLGVSVKLPEGYELSNEVKVTVSASPNADTAGAEGRQALPIRGGLDIAQQRKREGEQEETQISRPERPAAPEYALRNRRVKGQST